MRLPDPMAVSVTSCKSVHRILCTDLPVLSMSCRPIPARPRFAAEFTQESDRRNVHRSGFIQLRLSDCLQIKTALRSELKKKLELVAASEGRIVAQICDAFLQAGLIAYGKEGARYIRRFLARRSEQSQDH
jgi:hypothetical protein